MPTLHNSLLLLCDATHEKCVLMLSGCSLLIDTVAASLLAHLAVQRADSADWGLGAFVCCLFLHHYHRTFGPLQARKEEGELAVSDAEIGTRTTVGQRRKEPRGR